jgi:hypothetical protein
MRFEPCTSPLVRMALQRTEPRSRVSQGDGLGRHNLVLQSEGGAFPSINVGLVYMQNVQRGSAALWVVREVADRILRRLQMAQVGDIG